MSVILTNRELNLIMQGLTKMQEPVIAVHEREKEMELHRVWSKLNVYSMRGSDVLIVEQKAKMGEASSDKLIDNGL